MDARGGGDDTWNQNAQRHAGRVDRASCSPRSVHREISSTAHTDVVIQPLSRKSYATGQSEMQEIKFDSEKRN
jgi:hypothetical protein